VSSRCPGSCSTTAPAAGSDACRWPTGAPTGTRPGRQVRRRATPAFEDAAALGTLLEGAAPADVESLLARYDRLRRPRATAVARQARRTNRLLRLRGFPGRLRDAALRAVPQALATGALARQFAFDPPRR
jgi:hypothetical protein